MRLNHPPRPVVLIVLDGWGIAPPSLGNAISQAKTPNISSFWSGYLHTQLNASGDAVGLPRGEPGNTETGHLNLGAGQIVYQDLQRINMAIADGSFFRNQVILDAIKHCKSTNGDLHAMGLIGAGGVHSNIEHLFALLRLIKLEGFNRVFLHLFTDGRDSPPNGAPIYLAQIRQVIAHEGIGQIASIMGRYYAMDRDLRWDRTEKAYLALTRGIGNKSSSPEEAIQESYNRNISDEFIEPTLFTYTDGRPLSLIKPGDAVVFYNFRIDRPRQLTKSFVLDDFESQANIFSETDPYEVTHHRTHQIAPKTERPLFNRGEKIKNLFFVTMTEYQKGMPAEIAFPPQAIELPLGRIISERNLRQLRASESEKERFVTYYFNGQREISFPGEEHLIIPSPKVSTYDLKPEMSAVNLTNAVLERIADRKFDFILINFANPDMVGHSGNLGAAIRAVEVTDECVGKITRAVLLLGGCTVITADHGNAEEMINLKTGQTDTEHSTFPVPLILVHEQLKIPKTLPSGILADVAPTILNIMDIPKPQGMLGRNLLI